MLRRLAKILVWLGLSFILLSLLTVMVLIVLFKTTDPNLYKNRLSVLFQQQTGIQIQVAGDFNILFLPKPKVIMQDVLFYIPLDEEETSKIALHAQKLEMGIQFLSYLKQEVQIKTLFLQDALIQVLEHKEKKQEVFFQEIYTNLEHTKDGFRFKNLSIALQGGMLEGELVLQKDGPILFIKGNLQANAFNFDRWYESTQDNAHDRKKDSSRKAYDNMHLDLALKLTDCQFLEGKLNGNLHIKTQEKKPFITGTLTGKGFALEKFLHKPKQKDADNPTPWINSDVDIKLHFSEVKLPGGNLKGEVQINSKKKIIAIGKLEANKFVLGSSSKKNLRKLPNFLIPQSLFQNIPYQWSIKIDNLEMGNVLLQNVRLTLLNQDKAVHLKEIHAKMYDGELEGTINLKKLSDQRATMQTQLTGKHWDLDKFITPGNDSSIRGGRFDVQFQGNGTGKSFHEILGKWHGSFFWSMTDATIQMRRVQNSLSDILFNFLNVLTPFGRDKPTTTIHCAKIFFTINQGIARADKGIGIETNVLNALGTGQLNLSSEEMVFDFIIREKKGIDIDIGNFNNYAQLYGTLSNPQIQVQSRGFLEGGFSIFSALTTGGLSLLAEQIFELLGEEEHACDLVRR